MVELPKTQNKVSLNRTNSFQGYRPPINKNQKTNTQEPQKRIRWSLGNVHLAFFTGVGILLSEIVLIVVFNLRLTGALISTLIFILCYAVFLYFLLDPTKSKKDPLKDNHG